MSSEELKEYLRENCCGRTNLRSGKSLEGIFHISENELRRRVNRLRREGVPIASCRGGYFYARTAGEAYATIRALRKMTGGLEAAIRGLEESLGTFGGGTA